MRDAHRTGGLQGNRIVPRSDNGDLTWGIVTTVPQARVSRRLPRALRVPTSHGHCPISYLPHDAQGEFSSSGQPRAGGDSSSHGGGLPVPRLDLDGPPRRSHSRLQPASAAVDRLCHGRVGQCLDAPHLVHGPSATRGLRRDGVVSGRHGRHARDRGGVDRRRSRRAVPRWPPSLLRFRRGVVGRPPRIADCRRAARRRAVRRPRDRRPEPGAGRRQHHLLRRRRHRGMDLRPAS